MYKTESTTLARPIPNHRYTPLHKALGLQKKARITVFREQSSVVVRVELSTAVRLTAKHKTIPNTQDVFTCVACQAHRRNIAQKQALVFTDILLTRYHQTSRPQPSMESREDTHNRLLVIANKSMAIHISRSLKSSPGNGRKS